MTRWRWAVLLITGLAILVLWQCWPKPAPPIGPLEVTDYEMYLPMIYSNRPALKGVGLSGPCSAVNLLEIDWYYNWIGGPCVAGDPRYVGMIWGRDQMVLLSQAGAVARQGSGWLLGFNEPDLEVQANISPNEAAELWRQIEQQANGIKLVSPVPSQHDPGWLWRMVAAYEGKYRRKPRFDAIAAHYYAYNGRTAQGMKIYLQQVRRDAMSHSYDVDIWATEWGGQCNVAGNNNAALMRELVPWMREREWIGRYAWFASRLPNPPWTLNMEPCSLTDTQGLTTLGRLYKELK